MRSFPWLVNPVWCPCEAKGQIQVHVPQTSTQSLVVLLKTDPVAGEIQESFVNDNKKYPTIQKKRIESHVITRARLAELQTKIGGASGC